MDEDASMEAVAAAIRSDPKAVAVTTADLPAEKEDEGHIAAVGGQEAAPEAQEAPPEEEEVDVDAIMLPVTVDGEVVDVSIRDLKADYSGRAVISRRLQEATEHKQAVHNMANTLSGALQAHQERIARLDQALAQNAGAGVDWERMRRDEPGKYLLERERVREVEDARRALEAEHRQNQERQQWIWQQQMQEVSRTEAQNLLRVVPELGDPKTSQAFMQAMVKTAQARGISPNEVSDVMDHRQLKVLADLTRLEARQARAQENPAPKPSPLMRPTTAAASRPMSDATKLQLAALQKARRTGRTEDVAATLLVRKR